MNNEPMHTEEHHDAPAAPAASPLKTLAAKPLVTGVLAGIGVVLAIAIIAAVVALYKFGWEGDFAEKFARVLPLPAATVNGRTISYADYLSDIKTVRQFFAAQESTGQGVPAPEEADMRKGVIDRLIQNEILDAEAAARDIEVTEEETLAEYSTMAGEDAAAAEAQIMELYGWSPEEFRLKVIRPYLLEQKLAAAIANDPEFTASAEKEANEVLAKAKAGDDFAALAAAHSDDEGSAQNGGELGSFPKGVMVPEFETAAFALAPGEVSDIVKTQFGYHVIKVSDVTKKDGEVTEVTASHVLIAVPTVAAYLREKFDNAKIARYVSGLAPEEEPVIANDGNAAGIVEEGSGVEEGPAGGEPAPEQAE
jgi:PPIC-type PPIASE domain/SurA N-terminal domain